MPALRSCCRLRSPMRTGRSRAAWPTIHRVISPSPALDKRRGGPTQALARAAPVASPQARSFTPTVSMPSTPKATSAPSRPRAHLCGASPCGPAARIRARAFCRRSRSAAAMTARVATAAVSPSTAAASMPRAVSAMSSRSTRRRERRSGRSSSMLPCAPPPPRLAARCSWWRSTASSSASPAQMAASCGRYVACRSRRA